MTRVTNNGDTFCVDVTEVTADQFAAFVAAAPSTDSLPDACSGHGPPHPPPPSTGGVAGAITGVDWCDATAYCAWAGKRLCGRLGGGPLNDGDPSNSEWVAACGAGVLTAGGVSDWENGCTGNDDHDPCTIRGAACDAEGVRPRDNGAPDVGIRCCAP
jgi:formylglycine-generating enzyme required for sulfatase activity